MNRTQPRKSHAGGNLPGVAGAVVSLDNLALHRAFGLLLEAVDGEDFWLQLTRMLAEHVAFGSWVALCFDSLSPPQVLAECRSDDGQPDQLFVEYLQGLYRLDPFYVHAMAKAREGLVRLDDVAPDCFRGTDYFQRYFRLNVGADEVQFNAALPQGRMLCLSLGSAHRFDASAVAVLHVLSQWIVPLMRQRWRAGAQVAKPSSSPRLVASRVPDGIHFNGIPLSAREFEISQLMLEGHSSKVIANRLGIAPDTVKVHRKHLYSKLGINSQGELFSLYMKESTGQRPGSPGQAAA